MVRIRRSAHRSCSQYCAGGYYPPLQRLDIFYMMPFNQQGYFRLIQPTLPGTSGVSKNRAVSSRWVSFHLSKPAGAM